MAGRLPDQAVRVPVNLQQCYSLTFLHWPADPAALQGMLPRGLSIEIRDGSAWIGVTPFVMRRVRVPGWPVQVVPDFVEVNVRTYVRGPDGRNGIWFFSLECERLPVVVALRALGLPYMRARAAVRGEGTAVVDYASKRRAGGGELFVRTHVGLPLGDPDAPTDVLTGRGDASTERGGRGVGEIALLW